MLATYFGYWLMGAALLALAMLASLLTDNLTVAFILGAVFCAVPVFLHHAGAILSGRAAAAGRAALRRRAVPRPFRGRRYARAADLLHRLSPLAALYLNVAAARPPPLADRPEGAALCVCTTWCARSAWWSSVAQRSRSLRPICAYGCDVTAEKIHSLSRETRSLLRGLDPKQPVFIHAYFSPEVPRSYVDARNSLVGMLREFDAAGRRGACTLASSRP